MTEPLPDNVRQAGYDALAELTNRMFRGATSLSKHAALLRLEESKTHRDALAQLRRYQGFKMPCYEEVAVIEGALVGLTEPESRALSERRQREKSRQEREAKKRRAEFWAEHWEENWHGDGWQYQHTIQLAMSRAAMLVKAAEYAKRRIGGTDIVKALARCLDAEVADQDPFCDLSIKLDQIDGPGEGGSRPRRNGNVIAGPWDAGGEAQS